MSRRGTQMWHQRFDALIGNTDRVQLEIDRRTCNEKVRFVSKVAAKQSAKLTKRQNGNARVYECTVCRGWHITSWTREDERKYRRPA